MNKKIRVIIKKPFEPAVVKEIDDGLKPLQEIVGGYIESADLPNMYNVFGYCNDEGLINGMSPNIYRPEWKDVIFGPLVFCGADEEGESISLTDEQIADVMNYLSQNDVKNFGEMLMHIETDFKYYTSNEITM